MALELSITEKEHITGNLRTNFCQPLTSSHFATGKKAWKLKLSRSLSQYNLVQQLTMKKEKKN